METLGEPTRAEAGRGPVTGAEVLVAEILELARTHLDMDVAYLGELRESDQVHVAVAGRSEEYGTHRGFSVPYDQTWCSRMLGGQMPAAVGDLKQEPVAAAMAVTEATGVRAYAGAPVVLGDGRLYGTLCCVDRRARPGISLEQQSQLGFLSELLGRTIDRVEAATREDDELRAQVRGIIRERAFEVVLQPVFRLRTDGVVGFEALTRFPQEPRRGPDWWFADAWRLGLGIELELATIVEALAGLGRHQPGATLLLNASPETVSDERFFRLATAPRDGVLIVEVTEHAEVKDWDALCASLQRLREHGVLSAVDDAGAGFSSLSQIVRLLPDLIKMDMFFVRGIDRDRAKRSVASSLVAFARDVDARVLAEGVETPEELAAVRELGFDYAQGYLLGRPGPADAAPPALDRDDAWLLRPRMAPEASPAGTPHVSAELYHAVFHAAPYAVVVVDGDNVIRDWNPAAKELFGWSRSEAVGRSQTELMVPPERRALAQAGWERVAASTTRPTVGRRISGMSALDRAGARVPVDFRVSSNMRRGGQDYYFIFLNPSAPPDA